MNKKHIILSMAAVLAMSMPVAFTACSDDDLGETIFDPTDYPLDRSAYTFPLDTFVKKNFLEPYNLRYLYRMVDISSDMDYNLTPCSYDQCVNLAVLNKYLWYDVYKKVVGEEFLKTYSPRIIHVIGSPAYNPTTHTIKLGTAEGGLKITLFNAESLVPSDLDNLNEYFFKTMHHEFSHILHQTKNYPTDFNLISNGLYDNSSWQDQPDSVTLGNGFVSPYASSQAREDWVETIANYIVKDSITWNNMLKGAEYSWEIATDVNAEHWNKINLQVARGLANRDTVGYYLRDGTTSGGVAVTYQVYRKYVQRDSAGYAVPGADGRIVYLHQTDQDGRAIILKKLDMCKDWLRTRFNYDLDSVRYEVQHRQYVFDENDQLLLDHYGRPINRLVYVKPDGTTLMDSLRAEVEAYRALMPAK